MCSVSSRLRKSPSLPGEQKPESPPSDTFSSREMNDSNPSFSFYETRGEPSAFIDVEIDDKGDVVMSGTDSGGQDLIAGEDIQ